MPFWRKRWLIEEYDQPIGCQWSGCHLEFSSTYEMADHLQDHVNETVQRAGPCLWNGCTFASRCTSDERDFFALIKLYDHVYEHAIRHKFVCGQCDFTGATSKRTLLPSIMCQNNQSRQNVYRKKNYYYKARKYLKASGLLDSNPYISLLYHQPWHQF